MTDKQCWGICSFCINLAVNIAAATAIVSLLHVYNYWQPWMLRYMWFVIWFIYGLMIGALVAKLFWGPRNDGTYTKYQTS